MKDVDSQDISIEDETNDTSPKKSQAGTFDVEAALEAHRNEADPSAPEGTFPAHKRKSYVPFLLLLMLLVVLGAVFWIWKDQIVGYFVKQPATQSAQTQTTLSALDQQKQTNPELIAFITPKTGETWLATPKSMTAQGWLQVEQLSNYQNIGVGTKYFKSAQAQLNEALPTYTEVGSRAGNTIVLVNSSSEGFGGTWYIFEKHADGVVAAILQPQAASTLTPDLLSSTKSAVTAKVTQFDEKTHYDSLNIPAKIALGSGEYTRRQDYLWIADMLGTDKTTPGRTITEVAKLGGSTLYRSEMKYADTGLTNVGYYMHLPIGTNVGLRYEPNQSSMQDYTFDNGVTAQYKNGDGKMVYDELVAIARGCGGTSASVTRSDTLTDADLVQVGKSNTGTAVYEPKDKSAALYTKVYSEYQQSIGTGAVSMSDYVKNHGLLIMKNAQGQLLVYVRAQYAPSMGCAKPVVYLYPTQTMFVDVAVGATVTVSDPYYTSDGWKHVLATPDGKLTYQGTAYESLFWEGTGIGSYPGVVSGTVVERADAAATMRAQLVEQGLTTTEANDFMAYWEPKIPNKPYIRLTWFDTTQMDGLAPLRISPKPDTVLRVFLDMNGYDTPIVLPAQKLVGTERRGFTVVEWGGLTALGLK